MDDAHKHIRIRAATEADLDGLAATTQRLFDEDGALRDPLRDPDWPRLHAAEDYAADLANPDHLLLVADRDGVVVGHLLGGVYGTSAMWRVPRAHLISIYVQAPWRGRSVGSRLVADFSTWARAKGARQLRVTAYAANEGAVRFYRRHGFVPLETTLASAL